MQLPCIPRGVRVGLDGRSSTGCSLDKRAPTVRVVRHIPADVDPGRSGGRVIVADADDVTLPAAARSAASAAENDLEGPVFPVVEEGVMGLQKSRSVVPVRVADHDTRNSAVGLAGGGDHFAGLADQVDAANRVGVKVPAGFREQPSVLEAVRLNNGLPDDRKGEQAQDNQVLHVALFLCKT